ncbi:teicoplanin resistance protein VanZ [Thioclava sp. BHET1]|nr:teicoplanin resistance protein VanZ [Thioclava sp. BHET1]
MIRSPLLPLLLTAALVVIIAVGTLSPHPLLSEAPAGSDKLQHLIGFGSLVVPAALLRPHWRIVVAPAALLFGGLIEIAQLQVGRDGDFGDFLADALGIGLALLLCAFIRRLIPRLRTA